MAPKILVVLTSVDKYPNGKPTGWYLPEFAHPYHVLAPHTEITVASPKGGVAPQDPKSRAEFKDDKISVDFLVNQRSLYEETQKLEKFIGRAEEFVALFYVGGQGPMFDLATDPISHQIINEFHTAGKIVAAVCHGPAALAFVKLSDGTPFLSGAKVTGFSNSEEDAVGGTAEMPFLLETELNKSSRGGYIRSAENWAKHVVVDRNGKLITGQNPASAYGVGEALLKSIQA
ncbi:putative chaperone protein HSP31 [Cadophora sp. MPI-SDFR-AT-0126]|nr:putative chaperone protein HSP31 [Leotiomycetes sp. MPI-SDFR-AT-0126]